MDKAQKAAVVEEIADEIQSAGAIFAVDYRGLSVPQAAELRARLREVDTMFRVVKNSLSERAADKAGTEQLKTLLVGPTALVFVRGDAALAAKALNDAGRSLNILEFKGGLMDGVTLSADDVRSIARLPAREVLHAQLVGTIASPISGLVRGLNALIAGIAVQLQAIADQGLVSGEAPAAPAPEAATETVPEAEAVPEAEPEPETEAPPETEAASEADAAPEAEAEPEPAAEPEPEPAAEQSEQTEAQDASDESSGA